VQRETIALALVLSAAAFAGCSGAIDVTSDGGPDEWEGDEGDDGRGFDDDDSTDGPPAQRDGGRADGGDDPGDVGDRDQGRGHDGDHPDGSGDPDDGASGSDAKPDGARDGTADGSGDGSRDGSRDGGADAVVDAPPDTGTPIDCTGQNPQQPTKLGCTGLYTDIAGKVVAPGVEAYEPGYALWSDGAVKQRWIKLPPGTRIDTRNMNEWDFPVGTKLWKEFKVGGRRAETRFLFKRARNDWFRTTYVWTADEREANEVRTGVANWNGTGYEIPDQDDCMSCHQGREDMVLGFDAVSLSAAAARGFTMARLVAEGRVTVAPSSPVIVPGDAAAQAALGWLHANCGTSCHNRSGYAIASNTGLHMRLDVESLASVQATDTWRTAVDVPSRWQPPRASGMLRIKRGDPSGSTIYFRDSVRNPPSGEKLQMPPIATRIVDETGVALVRRWIEGL
jgi:hypothetical protein